MSAEIAIQPGLFFGQWAMAVGGLALLVTGGAVLWSILEWRVNGLRFEGTLIGVRRRGGYCHSVYRYVLPPGESCEATSIQGSGSLDGRYTGRQVPILVKEDHPEEARESHAPAAWAVGIGLLLGGGWLSYDAVTSWPHALLTWIILVLLTLWVIRVVLRRVAPLFATLRARAASSDWQTLPVEPAESMGAPEPDIRVTGATPTRASHLLCLAGLAAFAISAIPAYRLVQLRSARSATGRVVSLEQNHFNNNRYNWFPSVEFVDEAGRSVRFLDRAGANPSPYHVGDPVHVLYQPAVPSSAMIDHGVRNWEPVIALGLLGGTLIGVGLLGRKTEARFELRVPRQP